MRFTVYTADGSIKTTQTSGGGEINDLTSIVTWANVPDANITEGSVTQHEAAINHDALTGFVANEHLLVGAIDHDLLLNFASGEHFTVASIDHGSIGGLTDDDHVRYFDKDGSKTASGDFNMNQNQIIHLTAADFIGKADGATGAAKTIDFSQANGWTFHSMTVDQNTTLTFTNPAANGRYQIVFIYSGGAHTITWPAGVDWGSVGEPTWTTDGSSNIATFYYDLGSVYLATGWTG